MSNSKGTRSAAAWGGHMKAMRSWHKAPVYSQRWTRATKNTPILNDEPSTMGKM